MPSGFISLSSGAEMTKEENVTKAIKNILSENFDEDEATESQTLLYKNLWLEAEAALCSVSHKNRYNQMKIKMEKQSYKQRDMEQHSKSEVIPSLSRSESSAIEVNKCLNSDSSAATIPKEFSQSKFSSDMNRLDSLTPEADGGQNLYNFIHNYAVSGINKEVAGNDEASVIARYNVIKSRDDNSCINANDLETPLHTADILAAQVADNQNQVNFFPDFLIPGKNMADYETSVLARFHFLKSWAATTQVLGLLIEVVKNEFLSHIDYILPVTRRILQSAIHAVTNRQKSFESESNLPLWKEAYYSLVMLGKIIHQFHDLCFTKELEGIWEAICEMLLHPHSWLRNKSGRLIALYFARVTDNNRENHQSSLNSYFMMSPSRLYLIATSLCCQLKMPLIDEVDSNLMTQNIVFAFFALMRQTASIDPSAFWSTLEKNKKNRFLKAFDLINARRGRMMFMSSSLTSSVCEGSSQVNVKNTQQILVSLLLKKMGKIALQTDAIQMEIVFNSFGKLVAQIEMSMDYAHIVLIPLYKVSEGFAGKVVADNLKKLAEDTFQLSLWKINLDSSAHHLHLSHASTFLAFHSPQIIVQ